MLNHEPAGYECPVCLGIRGEESESTLIKPSDLIHKDKFVSAFINSYFRGKNVGSVIIVPNKHFENIYDLPEEYGKRIFELTKKIALAMRKAYPCEGITILQNNEPAADQHSFHFHLHVFPRFDGDEFQKHVLEKNVGPPEKRQRYAERLKKALVVVS